MTNEPDIDFFNQNFGFESNFMDWPFPIARTETELIQKFNFSQHVKQKFRNLSTGETRKLLLIKAISNRPKLLILDEATSSLDAQTESAISAAIRNLRGKVTVLIVAHRLSSVVDSDKVVYVDQGQIISEGSFQKVGGKVSRTLV